jgi:hypothetical protein
MRAFPLAKIVVVSAALGGAVLMALLCSLLVAQSRARSLGDILLLGWVFVGVVVPIVLAPMAPLLAWLASRRRGGRATDGVIRRSPGA